MRADELHYVQTPSTAYMKVMNNQRGFTLTELITIIVIVGILSVAALPRFFDNDVFQQRGAADQVKSALRFAQKAAVAKHTPVSVTVAQGSTDCATTLAGLALTCTVAVLDAGANTYTFNALGQLTAPAAPATLTIGGTTITIEAETGYVH
jgi:MSHA pilin protein MshC